MKETRTNQPTMKRKSDLDGADFYPTPAWATHALLEVENFDGVIWEPACGNGAMAKVLMARGHGVQASDLYPRGYCKALTGLDFLDPQSTYPALKPTRPNVVTNPPFHSAEAFVAAGLKAAEHKLALLLRLAFLESASRQKTIFNVSPPSRVWVFSERITFYPEGAERAGNGTMAYAWFVWEKPLTGTTELKWLPLGMKARFGE